MPKVIILSGVPTSGKSTFARNHPEFTVISSDNLIEQHAKKNNTTYNEVFEDYVETAVKLMLEDLHTAIDNQENIICDQTHLTAKVRKRKLKMFSPSYEKICLYFEISKEEMLKRNHNQDRTKVVPQRVLLQMFDSYKRPELSEGFDSVYDGQFYSCPLKEPILA